MTWIGKTAALAGLVLLAAGCRPTEPEPLDNAPTYEPTVEADAPETNDQPAPSQPTETLPNASQEVDQPAQSEAESDVTGDESAEGGVLGAVGRAMLRSVAGDAEETGEEESPPSEQ